VATSTLLEAAQYDDFEGYLGWGLGLQRKSCFRAFRLNGTARLVVGHSEVAASAQDERPHLPWFLS